MSRTLSDKPAGRLSGFGTERTLALGVWALSVALAAVLGARVLAGAGMQAEFFNFPYQLDESEGMIVAETMLMSQGTNIFDPVTPDLFIAAPYPPVYYLLLAPFQGLLGDEPSFKIGRAVTLFATVLAGLAVFAIVVQLTRSRLGGAVGALGFWSLSLVTFWGSLVKPDMLAVALGLAGLLWVVSRPDRVWWALPLFLLAFFTKQTSIAAAAAATGFLLLTTPRRSLVFGVLYAAGAVIPSALLDWATRGGYFYHMYTIHDLPWFAGRFAQFLGNFTVSYGVLLVPGAVAAAAFGVAWLARRVRREHIDASGDRAIMLTGYVLASLLVAIGSGTHGGNHNHLLDIAAACSLGIGAGLGVVLERASAGWKAASLAPLTLVLLWAPSLFGTPGWLQQEFNQLKPDRVAGLDNIFQYVTNNPGEAYSDNVGLLLAAHKRLWSTDPFTQTHATYYGRWDESKLVEAVSDRRFSQIVLRDDVDHPDAGAGDVSPGILQAVQDNYKLDQRNVLNIYVPR
jgi:hypothetical protein